MTTNHTDLIRRLREACDPHYDFYSTLCWEAADALEAMQTTPTLTDEQLDALVIVLAHYGNDSRIIPLRVLVDRYIEHTTKIQNENS